MKSEADETASCEICDSVRSVIGVGVMSEAGEVVMSEAGEKEMSVVCDLVTCCERRQRLKI